MKNSFLKSSLKSPIRIFNSSYTQHLSYDLSHKYPLSSTQRCLTYRRHIAHAHVLPQCSAVTDTLGISAYAHW